MLNGATILGDRIGNVIEQHHGFGFSRVMRECLGSRFSHPVGNTFGLSGRRQGEAEEKRCTEGD